MPQDGRLKRKKSRYGQIFCPRSKARRRYLQRNTFCLKNMSAPAQTSSSLTTMPQLDFREALSTPDQKAFGPQRLIGASVANLTVDDRKSFGDRAGGFSGSTWTNVFFVAMASVGAVFCAFYFFNGAQLLQAAAAWPGEFLYPRPPSDSIGVTQPDSIDNFRRTASDSGKSKDAPFDRNYFPSYLTQPGTSPTGFSPAGFDATASPFSAVTTPLGQLNFLPPGADSIFQGLYQRAMALPPKPVTGIVSNAVRSTRRRISNAQQKVAGDVNKLTNRTGSAMSSTNVTNAARSTVQNSQQSINSVSATSNSSLNSVRAQGQMMMNAGHGSGLGNGLSSGVGNALSGVNSGLRGVGSVRH